MTPALKALRDETAAARTAVKEASVRGMSGSLVLRDSGTLAILKFLDALDARLRVLEDAPPPAPQRLY